MRPPPITSIDVVPAVVAVVVAVSVVVSSVSLLSLSVLPGWCRGSPRSDMDPLEVGWNNPSYSFIRLVTKVICMIFKRDFTQTPWKFSDWFTVYPNWRQKIAYIHIYIYNHMNSWWFPTLHQQSTTNRTNICLRVVSGTVHQRQFQHGWAPGIVGDFHPHNSRRGELRENGGSKTRRAEDSVERLHGLDIFAGGWCESS